MLMIATDLLAHHVAPKAAAVDNLSQLLRTEARLIAHLAGFIVDVIAEAPSVRRGGR